ncbi:uncharacterized protein LOC124929812 [Impatiens glandulifera]|uniref:uncharacterized protein LOC124929812 n=1 Tax=Impatiens glandulifera TaxID=253017 RepID=UPI001FB16B4B|nr:uncharacterized protein LOC124929812 [Impatiens glandulifera]
MEADDDLGLGIAYTTQHRKRVMVVIDGSNSSKAAINWALTHVVNNIDLLTLLHIIPPQSHHNQSAISTTTNYLGSFCKACKPQVEVEALVLQGPKLSTIISQVKKLQVSVLILAQSSSPHLNWLLCGCRSEEFVEECIKSVDCLTVGVRKQKRGVGGYLITTKWKRNFWLLA